MYNSGTNPLQVKDLAFKENLESVGILKKTDTKSNNGEQAYQIFGRNSVIFPLKDLNNKVINFCDIL